ncbi:hypothetical protein [Streptomyces sp. N35]|uniref:hypothetical protein n=1 Tax=Streptomyces sp. N35 TaxID=2795730 RepID=UPI0018F63AED|nr:hypothetical protein [Streptomyces sp. N35]
MALVAGAGIVVQSGQAGAAEMCFVTSKHQLYCGNEAPVTLWKYIGSSSPQIKVDTLRTRQSTFTCWAKGKPHSGGNAIYYRAQGDDHGKYGFLAAVLVHTLTDPPSGLPKC